MPQTCRRPVRDLKKSTGRFSARRAAVGVRTLKSGQSQYFVGYKKHTLRLWLNQYRHGVLTVPLISWSAPANVSEGGLLVPSLAYCVRRWDWRPDYVVADMGYLGAPVKRVCRQQWQVAVLTHLRDKMKLPAPFEAESRAVCPQGQPLHWLGYDWRADRHEFGPTEPATYCAICWDYSGCSRRFDYAPAEHETLLGRLPLCTRAAQRMLQQIRPWIEPTQSYEKNQLGLSQVFLNSLRLTWTMSLLADAVSTMRTRALLEKPPTECLLRELLPQQLEWNWM